MLASVSSSDAPPLKRPAGLAFFTMPVARAPLGMATLPSTSTGSRTVAEKFWPGVLILEPTGSSSTTEITVSAGTTMGLGRGGASLAGLLELAPGSGVDGDEVASVAGACCWSAFFSHPANAESRQRAERDAVVKRRFMNYLRFERGLHKTILRTCAKS